MTQSTISVTRALAEMKRLDSRINQAITSGVFVGVVVGKGAHEKADGPVAKEALVSQIGASFNEVNDLITRRAAIKAALVKSNANTTVKVGGETMTVAEAIELKSSIELKRTFMINLEGQYKQAVNKVASKNHAMETLIEKNLEMIYGNEKGRAEKGMVEAVAQPQRDQKEAALLDPQDITKKIKELREKILEVETELDFTLSEVNARTTITV